MNQPRFDIINDSAIFTDYYKYNFNMLNMKANKIEKFVFSLR